MALSRREFLTELVLPATAAWLAVDCARPNPGPDQVVARADYSPKAVNLSPKPAIATASSVDSIIETRFTHGNIEYLLPDSNSGELRFGFNVGVLESQSAGQDQWPLKTTRQSIILRWREVSKPAFRLGLALVSQDNPHLPTSAIITYPEPVKLASLGNEIMIVSWTGNLINEFRKENGERIGFYNTFDLSDFDRP